MRPHYRGLVNDVADQPVGLQSNVTDRPKYAYISEADVKNYLRQRSRFDDDDIHRMTLSAVRKIESFLSRDLADPKNPLTRKVFWSFVGSWAPLPYGPHHSIDSIVSTDRYGTEKQVTPDQYTLEGSSFKTIRFRQWVGESIEVVYKGGDLPEQAIAAILPVVSASYAARPGAGGDAVQIDRGTGFPVGVLSDLYSIKRF